MRKNVSQDCSIHCLLLTAFLLSIGSIQAVSAQEKKSSPGGTTPSPQAAKKFVLEERIKLDLKGCSGAISIPSLGFSGTALEIDGERISLTGAQGETVTGELRSYARSAYWLDANIGMFFKRPTVPPTDPAWRPPIIVSLVLKQDRARPKEFTLTAAPGLNPDFPTTKLSCSSATGSVN